MRLLLDKIALFLYLYAMTDRELVVFLREQNAKLVATIASLSKNVDELNKKVTALNEALLEKDKDARKLKRFADINLPKKTEKRKYTAPVANDNPPAPTPKERGNNGAKRKV